ncbi:AAA family ATPase, partial [Variovorax sp. CT11-76]
REAMLRMQQSCAPLLATAKSEEGRRGRPYALVVDVLEQLLQFVLGCAEDEFALWRRRIAAAAKPVDRTLSGLLPALEAGSGVGRERVLQGMARLLACFASSARPLVILLDDLQWADAGTLQVLERLLHQHEDAALLLVGAYRAGEVAEDHPLRAGQLA